ncbi:MAG TPA: hypothetical protein PKC76_04520 [Saprospiraceae bacterium]|nr:hypothetical protein [Saprospiraceae bacterium]HMP23369.1 hypothetical protein [Saprospiraceae bacterium]
MKNPIFKNGFIAWSAALLLLLITKGVQAEQRPGISIFDKLHTQEVLKVEIETDLDSLLRTLRTEDEVPALFTFKDEKGKKQSWKVKLQVRGKFRRRTCDFPPLHFKFSKKQLAAAGLNDHNDLKLITHCFDNAQSDELVMREYLTYKLYQIVSPHSFRVQLLRVKYRDSQSKRSFTRYNVLVEDDDEMRERADSKFCNSCYGLPKDTFTEENLTRNCLFQYMIGNSDWSVAMLRNLKLLQPKDGSKNIIVPYDFDFSGIVSAPYARPDATLGIRTVRERVLLGFEHSGEEMAPTIEFFKAHKKVFLDYIHKFKPLSVEARREMIEYIESFYRCLESETDMRTPGVC